MKAPKNPESRGSSVPDPGAGITGSRRLRFGVFAFDPGARKLWRDGAPVQLPSRALDVLAYLVDNRHRIVEKEELLAAAWRDVSVTDDSLIHAISVTRRALGDDAVHASFIETIPRRGYRFLAAVEAVDSPGPALRGRVRDEHALGQPRLQSAAERWRTYGIATAAIVLLAVAATAAYRAVAGNSPAAVRLEQAAPPGTAIVSGGVVSPTGRHLAFVAQDDSGKTSLWVRALDSPTPRRLAGTEGASKPFFSPDGRGLAFFVRGRLLATDLEGRALRTIAAGDVTTAGGSWGSGGLILFADWPSGVRVVPSQGGPVRQITRLNHAALEIAHAWPHFLPDGRHFLYQVISRDSTQAGVYVGSVDAPGSVRLLDRASAAAYAPPGFLLYLQQDLLMAQPFDATRLRLAGRPVLLARGLSAPSLFDGHVISGSREMLAFREGASSEQLTWVNRTGAQQQALDVPASMVNFRLSPDGRSLLAASSLTDVSGLWTVDLTRGHWTLLAADGIAPLWSPDGRRLAYTSRAGQELYVRAATDDSVAQPVVRDPTVKVLNDWSRDGRHIIYAQHSAATKLDLWLLSLDGGAAKPLLNTSSNEAQARLSPDGRWIAYVSDESGTPEVYVRRYPGMDDPRLISAGSGGQPQWRADQQELFYLAQDRWLMAVAVAGSDRSAYGTPRRLFRTSIGAAPSAARDSYAVMADGQSFLIDARHERDRDAPITVMRNWAAGLQRPGGDVAEAFKAVVMASGR
jgi:Tol biopolymer transport system component/DNA-binding winged helix-turn-helix (wHTH) protein